METALGLPPEGPHAMLIDAGRWSAFPRRRLVLATLPIPQQPWQPAQRPSPWENHYALHPLGTIGVMMRARGISPHGMPRPTCHQLT
eukprot:11430465-Prorocentrum_lima.AAC.1